MRKGSRMSEESKKKMSLARLGRKPWNFGKKTGYIPSKGFKKGHTAWNKGIPNSFECRKKISNSNKGRYAWNKGIHTGLIPRTAFKKNKEHPFWKGGEFIDKHGYIMFYNPEHPLCHKSGYIRKHKIIMEKHINRYLNPEEIVHHINKNKLDNSIENLLLLPNEKIHQSIHARERNKFRNKKGQFIKVSP